jgi:hypothetical protein
MSDNRLNEVIRVQKRPSNFVLIDKTFLEDENLSFKAKGILAYLLSKPDNWKVIIGNLVNYSTDGKASVYAGLKELKESGYYAKKPIRDDSGRRIVRWESTVYEVPNSLLTDFQHIENQHIENQFEENREHNNNYITKELEVSNNQVQSSQTIDGQDGEHPYFELIKDNVGYDDFLVTNPGNMELIDEFINIIVDVLLTEGETIRIGGENKPRTLVKSILLKLTYNDVLHALGQFKSQQSRIKKKQQYILTVLYKTKMERKAHYANLVQSDWGYGGASDRNEQI